MDESQPSIKTQQQADEVMAISMAIMRSNIEKTIRRSMQVRELEVNTHSSKRIEKINTKLKNKFWRANKKFTLIAILIVVIVILIIVLSVMKK